MLKLPLWGVENQSNSVEYHFDDMHPLSVLTAVCFLSIPTERSFPDLPEAIIHFLCILRFYLKESKSLNIVFVNFRCEPNTSNTEVRE